MNIKDFYQCWEESLEKAVRRMTENEERLHDDELRIVEGYMVRSGLKAGGSILPVYCNFDNFDSIPHQAIWDHAWSADTQQPPTNVRPAL